MNRRSYNAIASDWDAARSSVHAYELRFLEHLTKDLPRPARVLDLGCGTGRPLAELLLKQGICVTGVDQAEDLLALARERLPEGRWLQAPMETFEPDEEYDGALIWDSLFHVPREHHEGDPSPRAPEPAKGRAADPDGGRFSPPILHRHHVRADLLLRLA